MIAAVRILGQIDFPSVTARFWEGAGPYLDEDGNLWRQASFVDGALDTIEQAINGEAFSFPLRVSGLDRLSADLAWQDYQNGEIIGSRIRFLTQDFDQWWQPLAAPDVRMTGRIDDLDFEDVADSGQITTSVTVQIVNRFTIRTLSNGGVYSDIDQKARSALLNPTAPPDRKLERMPLMIDQTIKWPRFN